MDGLRLPGGRTLLGLGTAGDRADDLVRSLGEIGARCADVVVIVHKQGYLRGRGAAQMDELYRAGAAHVNVTGIASYGSELEGLMALVEQAGTSDVLGVMCHQDRQILDGWLGAQGATVDSPETVRRKVLVASERRSDGETPLTPSGSRRSS